MDTQPRLESWVSGAAYDPFMGRWSGRIAHEFLRWLGPRGGECWLEMGCGTGALTRTITEMTAPGLVLATDRSTAYVTYARQRADAPVRLVAADATRLPIRPGVAHTVVSGLLLNFLPVPAAGVLEMVRVARVGGTVAAYVWDYAGGMELLRFFWDTAVELDSTAASLDEGGRFPVCEPRELTRLWQEAGLVEVQSSAVQVPTLFHDFEDYWDPFLGAQGPAPAYAASLSGPHRVALRERLRARLPRGTGGQIQLSARAWTVRGRRAPT